MQDERSDEIAGVLDQIHAGGWNVGDTASCPSRPRPLVPLMRGTNPAVHDQLRLGPAHRRPPVPIDIFGHQMGAAAQTPRR